MSTKEQQQILSSEKLDSVINPKMLISLCANWQISQHRDGSVAVSAAWLKTCNQSSAESWGVEFRGIRQFNNSCLSTQLFGYLYVLPLNQTIVFVTFLILCKLTNEMKSANYWPQGALVGISMNSGVQVKFPSIQIIFSLFVKFLSLT